ncbi:MAG TPA: alpha/beta fold hydrolase [Bacilli bacterium]
MNSAVRTGHQLEIRDQENACGKLAARMIKGIGWIVCAFAAALVVATALFAWIAWSLTHPAIAPLSANPAQELGAPYENIRFHSRTNNRLLSGWYIPGNHSTKTVVFSHGYGTNREEPWIPLCRLANALHKSNYNVFMFDYGYADQRQKFAVTAGVKEKGDLLGAIAYARSRGAKQIFVWGFSMGAGTALQAALIDSHVDGMILDSTFLLDEHSLAYNLKRILHLPAFPSARLLSFLFPYIAGFDMNEIHAQDIISHDYSFPIFFIHGKKDRKSPYKLSQQLYARQTNPYSRAWFPAKRGHEMTFRFQPKEYLRKTLGFLKAISASSDTQA